MNRVGFVGAVVLAAGGLAPGANAQVTLRVSQRVQGGQTFQAIGASNQPWIAPSGQYVAFVSRAANFQSPSPASADPLIWRYTVATGVNQVISVTGQLDPGGVPRALNGSSLYPAMGGTNVVYENNANNGTGPCPDTNNAIDIYLNGGNPPLFSYVHSGGCGTFAGADVRNAAISGDGTKVVYESTAGALVTPDNNGPLSDVFMQDVASGTITRLSVSTAGVQANSNSYDPYTNNDGSIVVFESEADNLVPGDNNGFRDIFIRYRDASNAWVTERVNLTSAGGQANGPSYHATLTNDGRYVCFQSNATNLVPGDTNGFTDVFVRDRVNSTTTRVSVAAGVNGAQANAPCTNAQIAANGRYVIFQSLASTLVPGDTDFLMDIFVRDFINSTIYRANLSTDGAQANDHSRNPSISADGQTLAYESDATNLVSGDTNGQTDVFVRLTIPPPINDICFAALPASLGSLFGSTTSTNRDGSSTCDDAGGAGDVWYRLQAPCTTTYTLSMFGASFTPVLSVHSTCPGTSANQLACDRNSGGPNTPRITINATAGTVYFIRVSGLGGGEGTFNLLVEQGSPVNDLCANATPIGNGTFPFDSCAAATDGGSESLCAGGGDDLINKDVWFRYTAPATGLVTARTCGTPFNTRLGAYNSVCPIGPNNIVVCNDDFCGQASQIQFNAVAGQHYLLRVGARGLVGGPGTLTVSGPTSCAPCVADFNNSGGSPDDADIAAFFAAWLSGSECADANGSGSTPDDADIARFFLLWNNGGC